MCIATDRRENARKLKDLIYQFSRVSCIQVPRGSVSFVSSLCGLCVKSFHTEVTERRHRGHRDLLRLDFPPEVRLGNVEFGGRDDLDLGVGETLGEIVLEYGVVADNDYVTIHEIAHGE